MNRAQLDKLIEYIDTLFAFHNARDSSDGGLTECIQLSAIRDELIDLVENGDWDSKAR